MRGFFWALCAVGCLLGGLVVAFGVTTANSAPQQAVMVSLGIALAVIPYCLARAMSEIGRK